MSYATVEEADKYVKERYMTFETLRKNWDNLSSEDRQTALTKANDIIDNLPLTGRKYSPTQSHAFPRGFNPEIPEKVRYAEVELALSYSDSDTVSAMQEYRKMIDYGISAVSVGNFSESFLTYGKNGLQLHYGLISTEAERFLAPWLTGGFCFE